VLLGPFVPVAVAERTEEFGFGNAQKDQEQAGKSAAGIALEDDEGHRSTLSVGTHDFAHVEELAEEHAEDSRQLSRPVGRAKIKVFNTNFLSR